MYRYLYTLGHQPYVSVLELKQFITLEGSLKAGELAKFAQSNELLEIKQLGGTIARLQVLASSEDKKLNYGAFLQDAINHYSTITKVNKVGVFSNSELNKPKIIQACKAVGAKKINVLDQNVFPSIGHIKSALTWFGIIRTNTEILCAVIEEYSDQQHWQDLDRLLPHKDMKRGIMNLKLSRILMNMTQDTLIWDPFCGHGRTLIGGMTDKQTLIGSDRDGHILGEANENLLKAYEIEHKKNPDIAKPMLKLFAHDATAELPNSLLPDSGFSIVTEGYLGPALSIAPDDKLLTQLFWETNRLWTSFFRQLEDSKVKDIVFCIPAYRREGRFITNIELTNALESLVPTHERSSHYQDIYARNDAVVGHQILVLKRK